MTKAQYIVNFIATILVIVGVIWFILANLQGLGTNSGGGNDSQRPDSQAGYERY